MASTFQNTIPFPFAETLTPEQYLDNCLVTSSLQNAVLIIPTGRYSRMLKQYIAKKIYTEQLPPLAQPIILTLEECINRVHSTLYATSVQQINEAFRVALIESAASKVELTYFTNRGKNLSRFLLQSLANIIYGLKEDGNMPENLEKDIAQFQEAPESAITNVEKYSDIYKLFKQYEQLLQEGNLADPATMLRQVCEGIEQQDSPLLIGQLWQRTFPECRHMFISGFTEFKKPEIRFLTSLLAAPFAVRLSLDYSEENGPLFGNLHDTGTALRQQGFMYRSAEDIALEHNRYEVTSAFLRRWLFNTEKITTNENLTDKVHLFEFLSPFDEVQGIVRYIKHLILNEKYHPSEIALLLPISEQASLYRELFRYYGIPVNITDRRTLAHSAVATEVLLLLRTIVLQWRAEEIRQVMNSRYISRSFSGQESNSKHILLNVAASLRIRGGHRQPGFEGWNERLQRRIASLETLINLSTAAGDTDSVNRYKQEQEHIVLAQKTLQEIDIMLPTPPQSCTADEFITFIQEEIIDKLSLQSAVLEYYNQARILAKQTTSFGISIVEEAEREARSFAALQAALEEYKHIYRVLYQGKKVSLAEHVKRLETSFVEYKYQSLERQGYGVTVTSAEQIRGIPFKVTILCSMNDGVFPRPYVPERFLGKALANGEDTYLKQARVLFYQVLTNNAAELDTFGSARKIIISYATSNNGEKLIASPFVAALRKVLPEHHSIHSIAKHPAEYEWYNAPAAPDEFMKKRVLATVHTEVTVPDEEWQYLQFLHNNTEQTILQQKAQQILSSFGKNPISPSALETYAACPYQFFAQYILSLSETDSKENALSSLEKGNVLHAIVYEFYRDLQRELATTDPQNIIAEADGIQLIPVRLQRQEQEKYLRLLLEKTEQILATVQFYHPFFQLDKDELLGTDFAKGTLERWLESELNRHEQEAASTNFAPALMELSFGRARRNNSSAFGPVHLQSLQDNLELQIKGAVDRVELAPAKDSSQKWLFRVSDYKSGGVSKYKDTLIEKGQHFQMPLYISAVKYILENKFGIQAEIAGGRYYSFKQGTEKESKIDVVTNNADEIIQTSIQHALRIRQSIAENAFPVQPNDTSTCEYCSYKSVCRVAYNITTSSAEERNTEV